MAKNISAEEGAELQRLLAEHTIEDAHARAMLAQHGIESPQFLKADMAKGVLWQKIRKLQGMADKHWMA